MHEKPRGFEGFRVSPAALLIDGITHNRTAPDWMVEREKRQRQKQFEREQAAAAIVKAQFDFEAAGPRP